MRPLPQRARPVVGLRITPNVDSLVGLDDHALLHMLLNRGAFRETSQAAVTALFERFGCLSAIASADVPELARVGRLGSAALTDLKLLRLLAERLARSEASQRPVITTWSALLAYVKVALAEQPREQFRALFLDRRNRLLRDELIAHGTIDHAPVYPREVVRRALEVSAAAIILVHNHPSGDPEPSRADVEMTRRVADAAKVFGIDLHDHLVVGSQGTASLRALGLLT